MAAASWPAWARARAAGSPRRMLTSCSGDGPPKITAGWLTGAPGSWIVVGQVVLVEDGVALSEVLQYPLHRFFSRVDQHDGDPAPRRAPAEGGPVGLADDDEMGRVAGGDSGG